MAITLNEITKYIKFNNSALKFNLEENPHFIQDNTIPKRIINPEDPILDTGEKDGNENVLRYKKDEIINLPNFLDKFIDLNNYYTFGVDSNHSFIHSLFYSYNTNFKFLSEEDKGTLITEFNLKCLEKISGEKNKQKSKITKALNEFRYNCKELIEYLVHYIQYNIIVIDLNEKTHSLGAEFNYEFTSIIILKSGDTYFPLASIDGSELSTPTCLAIMKHFS
jgi:hypothetical protein